MWVVSIDSSCCNIYQYDKGNKVIKKLKQLTHNECKMKNHALSSDKSGKYGRYALFSHGTFSPRIEPKENEKEQFASIVANELNLAKEKNLYHSIILASNPKMKGLLNKKLNTNVKMVIKRTFNSSFNDLDNNQILQKIKPFPIET